MSIFIYSMCILVTLSRFPKTTQFGALEAEMVLFREDLKEKVGFSVPLLCLVAHVMMVTPLIPPF